MRTKQVSSGGEALALLRTNSFDLVFVAMHLQDMDAPKFSSHIRADSQTQQVPIIMVTSNDDKKLLDEAFSAGISEIFAKHELDKITNFAAQFSRKKFNTDYRICADWDFNLYCFAAYKTQYIPLTISVFSTGGLSSLNEDRIFEANRWYTIIDYFRLKLLTLPMPHEKKHFKATAKKLWRSGYYKHSSISFMTYLAQKYFQRT